MKTLTQLTKHLTSTFCTNDGYAFTYGHLYAALLVVIGLFAFAAYYSKHNRLT